MSPLLAHVLLLLGGFGALYFGAEWLIRGAARVASTMGVSPVVVGLTIVSLGTSAPELVVCIVANLDGNGDLLTGNILGSNLANIGLILGATAVIRPLAVPNRVISRDVPIMILVSLFFLPLVMDKELNRGEGIFLLALLVVYVAFTFRTPAEDMKEILGERGLDEVAGQPAGRPGKTAADFATAGESAGKTGRTDAEARLVRDFGLIVAGAAGLGIGGHAIVTGAEYVAGAMGIGGDVMGFTVVAVGTSLPELVTAVVAAARHHGDIAVGNIVGSNIFNLTAVAGATAAMSSFEINSEVLNTELGAVVVLSILIWPIVASAKRVRRAEGLLLILAYVGFMGWLALAA